MRRFVLALDQGTTSSRAVLFDAGARPVASAHVAVSPSFPRPGWVEHDAEDLYGTTLAAARSALRSARVDAAEVAALGVTNQRETIVAWDRATGRAIAPAIIWQCRRTTDACARLKRAGREPDVARRTGLRIDPYFSATKAAWILKRVPEARELLRAGRLAFGTVDSWLLARLTGGRLHTTDASNASRTLLFNLEQGDYDPTLLKLFGVPRAALPAIVDSSAVLGETDARAFGAPIPIAGVAGDQQAALFGQGCFRPGDLKVTYGTGAFLLMNVGAARPRSRAGLLTTVAWRKGGSTTYALEGGVFVAGAAVQWLRDALGLIADAAETEALAESVAGNDGVHLVPAFVGLGAPYWDPDARGALLGLTRGTGRAHLARAALEAIAFQTRDLVDAMAADAGFRPRALRVDGGAARNGFLCRFQADVLGVPVVRAAVTETTALGAAFLAGLAVGFWKDEREIAGLVRADRTFEPTMRRAERERLYAGWSDAVRRVRSSPLRKPDR